MSTNRRVTFERAMSGFDKDLEATLTADIMNTIMKSSLPSPGGVVLRRAAP